MVPRTDPITWDYLVAKWKERTAGEPARFIFELRNTIALGFGDSNSVAAFNDPIDLYNYVATTWHAGRLMNVWSHGKMLMRHDDLLRLFQDGIEFADATREVE